MMVPGIMNGATDFQSMGWKVDEGTELLVSSFSRSQWVD